MFYSSCKNVKMTILR